MTSGDRPHWVDEEQIALLRRIISEFRLPVQHRIVLTAVVEGHPIRAAARFAGLNKDKAHRIVLRYLRIERVTTCELHDLPLHLSTDPRRIKGRKRLTRDEFKREGESRGRERPPSGSELTALYFEQAAAFIEHATFKWELDKEVWRRHAAGESQNQIGREMGLYQQTVFSAIRRVRVQFREWLRQRAEALQKQREDE